MRGSTAVVTASRRAVFGHHSMLIERIVPVTDTTQDTEVSSSPNRKGAVIGRRTVPCGHRDRRARYRSDGVFARACCSGGSLSFSSPSYSGVACSTISNVALTANENGAPKAGVSVTATLSDGYTFSNGGSSFTGVTGSSGSLNLPDIYVPASAATSTIMATSAAASSGSATLSGSQQAATQYVRSGLPPTPPGCRRTRPPSRLASS